MIQKRASKTRQELIDSATKAICRSGFARTTVEAVCAQAKVSKGAFFHHFASKEELVEACLENWDARAAAMEAAGPFQGTVDPRARLLGYMDFYIAVFENPGPFKSCLAGTTVQEMGGQNATLRAAANACFLQAGHRLQGFLDAAFRDVKPRPDTASLAALWIAAIQGALILFKAPGEGAVLSSTLRHVRAYIASLLPEVKAKTARGK